MKAKDFPYPVSVKAYQTFIVRIRMVIRDKSRCETMEKALHCYLAGRDKECFGMLDGECRLAFAFLRHDIDDAVCRSVSARERALKRKAKKEEALRKEAEAARKEAAEASASDDAETNTDDSEPCRDTTPELPDEEEAAEAAPIKLSRRERSARERALRPKRRRWLPIG